MDLASAPHFTCLFIGPPCRDEAQRKLQPDAVKGVSPAEPICNGPSSAEAKSCVTGGTPAPLCEQFHGIS